MIIQFDQLANNNHLLITNNQRIVLVGGVFDLLHIGHLHFLEKAKEAGDVLVVLLESDSSVKKKKGNNRPINIQADRATMLAALRPVDHIILLPDPTTDIDYQNVTKLLKPAIIATTIGDPYLAQKQSAAKSVGAQVREVIQQIDDKSTSHLAQLLAKEIL